MGAPDVPPLVFVTVGTDHHPFDRLVRWVDEWAYRQPPGRVRCRVQTGTSVRPQHVESAAYLGYDEMVAAMGEAVAVVCHGGPATIMDCRDAGLKPIVVPRRPEFGEHVDGHQVAFTTRLAALDQIAPADTPAALETLLDEALAAGDALRLPAQAAETSATTQRLGALVDALLAQPRRPRWRRA
jgi:UDP-N-acetylglucosamine transferase subunit ALG13